MPKNNGQKTYDSRSPRSAPAHVLAAFVLCPPRPLVGSRLYRNGANAPVTCQKLKPIAISPMTLSANWSLPATTAISPTRPEICPFGPET